jgi:molybdate transport system substrate-binding protein
MPHRRYSSARFQVVDTPISRYIVPNIAILARAVRTRLVGNVGPRMSRTKRLFRRALLSEDRPMAIALRAFLFLLLALVAGAQSARAEDSIVVFAAASLKDALDEAAGAFKAQSGVELKISYAGSLALAKQIEQGAPADIFASADQDSMDYAAQRNSIKPETRFNLLGNKLVVIVDKDSPMTAIAFTHDAFQKALGNGRLATGEVSSVPVGKYAKSALEKLGLWTVVESKLAMSDNVRTAMTFVSRGEAPIGIVYATDAAADKNVKVIATFPEDSHAPIIYPVAQTATSKNPAAPKLLDFLKSAAAKPIFEKQGFTVLK